LKLVREEVVQVVVVDEEVEDLMIVVDQGDSEGIRVVVVEDLIQETADPEVSVEVHEVVEDSEVAVVIASDLPEVDLVDQDEITRAAVEEGEVSVDLVLMTVQGVHIQEADQAEAEDFKKL
jgi:hypothetical protein